MTIVGAAVPFALHGQGGGRGRWNEYQRGQYGPPRYAVRYLGANIKTWCFDKSRRTRRQQILQVKSWGFEKLRDNHPFSHLDQYDLYHGKAVMEECLEMGIEYTITGADRNPGLENLISAEQVNALLTRYPKMGDVRTVITVIGCGLNIPTIRSFLLDNIAAMRGIFPQGVRMQAWNGPETEGAIPWNLYDPEFRQYVADLGFPMPGNLDPVSDELNIVVKNHYDSFKAQAQSIWGSPWLGESVHVYWRDSQWGNKPLYTPWQPSRWVPVITEYGVNHYQVADLPNAFLTMPNRIIQEYAQAGVFVADDAGVWNVQELFLHEPLDPGWIDLWQNGDTRALWNPEAYARLKEAHAGGPRGPWPEYGAVMLDRTTAAAVTQAMVPLKENRMPSRDNRPGQSGPYRRQDRWFRRSG